MKLAQFINDHVDEILVDWDSFAQTLWPAACQATLAELRDHGKRILREIAHDMEAGQSHTQRLEKSRSHRPASIASSTAAAAHGEARHEIGFTLLQLTSEYRALRASILRVWLPRVTKVTAQTTDELVRFNEAIDKALAESACRYSQETERVRDTFLAILGHDLRSPLATMAMAGAYLSRPEVGSEATQQVGARVRRRAASMSNMGCDLLEFARTQLGGKLPLARHLADLHEICELAVADARAAHPHHIFELEASGELLDDFDGPRLQQVLANLLNNAAQYSARDQPVVIVARGEPAALCVEVTNVGPVIPPESLDAVFSPWVQLHREDGSPSSLGLGLFIAREITEAHGGTISVASDAASGTRFTLRFKRTQAPVPTGREQ